MTDEAAEPNVSSVLKADWSNSRWGKEGQRGNGTLMTREKTLEAVKLIRTGKIVSLGMPYDTRMPIAPGRAYALQMPGGPTGGPYGSKSKTYLERPIHRHGNRPDRQPDGRPRPSWLHVRAARRRDEHAILQRQSSVGHAITLRPHETRHRERPVFTRGVLFDVQGLKGRALDVGEEIACGPQGVRCEPGRHRRNDNAGRRSVRAHCAWKPMVP
jgi:hypothetical protein